MKRRVVKFGGSVLKSPDDILKLESVIRAYDPPVVVVVSALFGITDKLSDFLAVKNISDHSISDLIRDIRDIHYRILNGIVRDPVSVNRVGGEIDVQLKDLADHLTGILLIGDLPVQSKAYVLSAGERLSSTLISNVLNLRGLRITHIMPEAAGIFTRGPVLNSSMDLKKSSPILRKTFSDEEKYMIPGFFGISDMERIALFGRGGSDYTAAGIAAGIGADSCDLWKDVNGFMTADPAVTKKALKIPLLSYGEAAELSYFGAGITHPETFSPLKLKNIPLKIFDTGRISSSGDLPLPSTIIAATTNKSGDVIKSITGSTDFAVLRIKGSSVGIHPGIISDISHKFSLAEINIRSIITSQTTINFLLTVEDMRDALKIVRNLALPDAEEVSADKDIALIAAVGEGFRDTYGVAARTLSALSRHRINVSLMTAGASDEAIYFTIEKKECTRAVKLLHREFFE